MQNKIVFMYFRVFYSPECDQQIIEKRFWSQRKPRFEKMSQLSDSIQILFCYSYKYPVVYDFKPRVRLPSSFRDRKFR